MSAFRGEGTKLLEDATRYTLEPRLRSTGTARLEREAQGKRPTTRRQHGLEHANERALSQAGKGGVDVLPCLRSMGFALSKLRLERPRNLDIASAREHLTNGCRDRAAREAYNAPHGHRTTARSSADCVGRPTTGGLRGQAQT